MSASVLHKATEALAREGILSVSIMDSPPYTLFLSTLFDCDIIEVMKKKLKAEKRETKQKPKMRVSGKKVFVLKEIIIKGRNKATK